MSRKEEILALLLVFLIAFSGYNLFGRGSGRFRDANIEGGALSEGLIGKVQRLNPLYTNFNSVDRDIASLIFSGLSKYDPLEKKFVDDIATHTLSPDKKIYTFQIRDNTFWHDGVKVTADDVYFTYHDIIQNENFTNPILKANFEGIEIKKIDEKTITFTLQQVNSFFFTNTTVGLLPKHILDGIDPSELESHEFNAKPIGTGPFVIQEAVKSNKDEMQIFLTSFPKFYGEKPKITDMRFFTFVDEESLFENRNSLNALSKISQIQEKEILEKEKRFTLYPYTLPQYVAIFLNMESPLLKNEKIRLALSKAIDKDKLIETLGNKVRIDTPLMELDQENWMYQASKEEAMGALYDSGWRYDDSKTIRKNQKGEELNLRLLTQKFSKNKLKKEENEKTLEFLQKSWEEVGIKISIEYHDEETFNEKVKEGTFDMILTGQSLGYNLDTYAFWHSSQAGGENLNLSNYKSPIADNLIETIRGSFNPEVKQKKLQNLAAVIQSDIPAIFLYSPLYSYAVDNRVENIQVGSLSFPSDRLTHLAKWYIKKE